MKRGFSRIFRHETQNSGWKKGRHDASYATGKLSVLLHRLTLGHFDSPTLLQEYTTRQSVSEAAD